MATSPDPTLRFGHFELIPAERTLRIRGEAVAVGSRAFDVLLTLAERHDRLVTKQELLDRVWPGLVVEEHNIATQIGNLRKLLGASAIATLPGYGYRLTVLPQAKAAATDAGALPGDLPTALSTDPPRRHNLPAPRTRFIGREAVLAELARLLASTRLLTLTGIGGSGKTRLALRLAQQLGHGYAGGTWFVDLAPLREPEGVAGAVAAVLGVASEGQAPLADRLRDHLAPRPALLLLDNCEHVLDGVAPLVETLLAAGDTTVLATSREGLGLSGEQIYPVRPLQLPATDDLPTVLAAESARVFIDRVRLTVPDFEVQPDEAAALAIICRRLDGIALALELAASRVSMFPLAEIAARLDDRFRLLAGGSRAMARHQTLLAAMHWSYDLLDAAQQRMLRHASVFAGGWSLAAAADVAETADEYDALALLSALHDKSLLEVDREHTGGRPRYRMLETVRQFALDRLHESQEAAAARGRHAAHCLRAAEDAAPRVRGPEQDRWMGWFRQEHENLVAAMNWCLAGPVDPQWALRLVAACGYYFGWNSPGLGHRLGLAALAHDKQALATPARGSALRALARLSQFLGRYEDALTFAEQSLVVARQVGEPLALAWSLFAVGMSLQSLGRGGPALAAEEEALALARQQGDGVLAFSVLNSIAAGRHGAGELEAAELRYREALALARIHSGRVGLVAVLDNLVRVLVARGHLDDAWRFAIECLPLARQEVVGIDLVDSVVGLASAAGDHATAARFWGASDRYFREWGYTREPYEARHLEALLARTRHALGDEAFERTQAGGRTLDVAGLMQELERWLAGGGDTGADAPTRKA